MATFVLLHGAGSDSWYWHRVLPELRSRGHDVVAPDLPCDDDSAGLAEYTDVVVDAIGDRKDVVLVAQSMAGFTAPLVAHRVPVELIVLVAAMVPAPGEAPGEWWANTGQPQAERELAERQGRDPDAPFDPFVTFLHDVPEDVLAESGAHVRDQSGTPFERPWPLDAWPSVPTRFVLCRADRFFPAAFQRRVVAERLGIVPDELDCGHLPALARPVELADLLHGYWTGLPDRARS
ncbi:pimeloyl-ACP methyl ester carboxylesterase [Prauserella shujinwangii]|uniref:Pimeloyl-ACP methyl ester carboxylesterase n=1 Tax=Prauserella shujinwangii TaxID=1453103 RepID=A0A2T0M171_9PSEU|nr:alpha/beta hydrolase [Prauserella shujinwangii]PRX50333.1 pimeloyl-ACP methyl ester carboxylesterase [Prauserella shujinwangii]